MKKRKKTRDKNKNKTMKKERKFIYRGEGK